MSTEKCCASVSYQIRCARYSLGPRQNFDWNAAHMIQQHVMTKHCRELPDANVFPQIRSCCGCVRRQAGYWLVKYRSPQGCCLRMVISMCLVVAVYGRPRYELHRVTSSHESMREILACDWWYMQFSGVMWRVALTRHCSAETFWLNLTTNNNE